MTDIPHQIDTTQGLELQEKGKRLIPGLSQLLSKRPDMFAPGVWPGYYSRAKGAEVWDLDGNRYTDMSISGIGANVLGYADPDVDAAVKQAIENGSSCSLNCPEEVELAELMCKLHPWAGMVRYARAGGEAMAIAIRIARAATGRDKVAFCGYHGWYDWYLAANLGTENALGEHLLPGLNPCGVPKGLKGTALPFRYNHPEELREIVQNHKQQLAAVVMEPIRSDWPEEGFFDQVIRMTRDCGAVFVLDEISAGFRMLTGGAHMKIGVTPDMAVFSKAMGNGYPIAAVIGKTEVMEAAQNTFVSSTNWTERIGPTAALATIKKHKLTNTASHLMRLGQRVQNGWKAASEAGDVPIHVSGIYPLSHFVFKTDDPQAVKALFVQLMMERGYLATTMYYPMLAHTDGHVDGYLEACQDVFGELAVHLRNGTLRQAMKGRPATDGFKRLT
jgi:glutamate-1-semialdehyde 2,1-aminomutase